jgi:hypothetical protein
MIHSVAASVTNLSARTKGRGGIGCGLIVNEQMRPGRKLANAMKSPRENNSIDHVEEARTPLVDCFGRGALRVYPSSSGRLFSSTSLQANNLSAVTRLCSMFDLSPIPPTAILSR